MKSRSRMKQYGMALIAFGLFTFNIPYQAQASTLGPTIITDSGSATFVSGDNTVSTPVVIDSGLTVTDAATDLLDFATVRIAGNFQFGEDVLAFTNNPSTMGQITGSYNASTGLLTLSEPGGATVAQYQAALDSVTYTDTAITPTPATRTISFSVQDASLNAAVGTRTVTVADTDQTPIVTTTGGTTNYPVFSTTPVTVDSGVTVSDKDNSTLASATVSIASGFQVGDTLQFVNTSSTIFGNIVASYNSTIGVLTMTSSGATATRAQWGNALSAVSYVTSSSALGTRTIAFVASDGTKSSVAATDAISVLGPPVVTTDAGSASFIAGDNTVSTPVAVDSGLTVTDATSSTLLSATVAISAGFFPGDVLSFNNTSLATFGNITGHYDAAHGVLALDSSPAATLAQWQAALDSVMYTNTAITPPTNPRTISINFMDANNVSSNTATRTITVTDTDQTPIVTTTGGTTNYSLPSTTPVTVDSGVTVSDKDNPTLPSATVSIASGFKVGDTLQFVNTNGALFGNIVASYNSGTGVLTMTSSGATATLAQWGNALSTVAYDTSSSALGRRTIAFLASDGTKSSVAATDSVAVAGAVIVAPPALALGTNWVWNGQYGVPFNPLQLQAVSGHGPYLWSVVQGNLPSGLTLSSLGVISGTPNGTSGTSTFSVEVKDASGQTAIRSLSILITGAPSLHITTTTLPTGMFGKDYSQQLLGVGVGSLAWSLGSGRLPNGLSLNSDGLITGKPAESGTFSFTLKVTDLSGNEAVQSYTMAIQKLGQNQRVLIFDGQAVTVPGIVRNNTTYMPIWYVMHFLASVGIQSKWDGHSWQMTTSVPVDLTHVQVGTGTMGMYVNGHLVQDVNGLATIDPSTGKSTTYMPIWYVMQMLKRLGLYSTWDGTTWTVTK